MLQSCVGSDLAEQVWFRTCYVPLVIGARMLVLVAHMGPPGLDLRPMPPALLHDKQCVNAY